MNKLIIQSLITFVVLAMIQVLVCNNISILNVATPFIFIYVIMRLPLTMNQNWMMIIGFIAGLIIDIFSDTAGMNALACTILSSIRNSIVKLYVTHEDEITDPNPSVDTLGPVTFIKYLFTMTFVYCLTITFIEAFTLRNALLSVYRAIGSTLLSFVIIWGVDALINAKHERI